MEWQVSNFFEISFSLHFFLLIALFLKLCSDFFVRKIVENIVEDNFWFERYANRNVFFF